MRNGQMAARQTSIDWYKNYTSIHDKIKGL